MKSKWWLVHTQIANREWAVARIRGRDNARRYRNTLATVYRRVLVRADKEQSHA